MKQLDMRKVGYTSQPDITQQFFGFAEVIIEVAQVAVACKGDIITPGLLLILRPSGFPTSLLVALRLLYAQ